MAGWSGGKELDELKASLDRIKNTAAQIIQAIEPEEQEIPQQRQPARKHPAPAR